MRTAEIFTIILFFSCGFAYGEQKNSYPNSVERQFMTLVNAVRINPVQFATEFMGKMKPLLERSVLSELDSHPPLTISPGLNQAAREFVKAHSEDKVPSETEIKQFLDNAKVCEKGYSGFTAAVLPEFYASEGTTKDEPQALQFLHHLLCNAKSDKCTETSENLSNADFLSNGQTQGAGVHNDSPDGVPDNDIAHFVGAETCTGETPNEKAQRVSGSHLAYSKNVRFIATYTADKEPTSVELLIDKTSYPMKKFATDTLDVHKHYVYTYELASASSCRKYIFRARTTNKEEKLSYYYPQSGKLATFGDGACTTDFEAGPENKDNNTDKYKPALKIWVFVLIGLGVLFVVIAVIVVVVILMRRKKPAESYKKLDDADNYVAPSLKNEFKSDFDEPSSGPKVPPRPSHFDD